MKRATTLTVLSILLVMAAVTLSGCYTKFYRPGMDDRGAYSTQQLYNPIDSTAIDTTLTVEDWTPADTYPEDNNWSYWGRYRRSPRWGFDFYNFSPDYYWSYYGYYDYYGVPWWNDRYHNPWYYWGPDYGYHPGPAEPPSSREGRNERGADPGGSYTAPPPGSTYAQPSTPSPNNGNDNSQKDTGKKSDDNKRDGRRGR